MNKNINKRFNWYMISTVSLKEDKVVESLENRIKSFGLEDDFLQIKIFKTPILTAKEEENRLMGNKYKIKMQNLYKGYIFIKMNMSDEAWFLVRNTQYVTGLVGSSGKGTKATPVSDNEIKKMFDNEQNKTNDFYEHINKSPYELGREVIIKKEPYMNQKAVIKDVDFENKSLVVEVEFMGRKTDLEISFVDVTLTHH